MGNFTGKISNNGAHAQAVSSRPPFRGLVKEAILDLYYAPDIRVYHVPYWRIKVQVAKMNILA